MADVNTLPELIEDRALRSPDQDLLRHEDVAGELADLVLTAELPSTIAVYGAWGTGKSSLANLIAGRLKDKKGVRFARFDAFKFAEYPLRRHFLSQVAARLEVRKQKFREGLYRTTRRTNLEVPKLEAAKLVGIFVLILAVVLAAATGLIALLALAAAGSFDANFARFLNSGLALAFAPAALLAAFVALAGKALPVDQTTTAPSSEEEFERLFGDLVEEVGADRLVIFIDELDRCAPAEVVSTLETVRTFLDVPGVVLIVAADQQVLERALRVRARQATPIDAPNPYFSAGSEYLDKIFQYQVSLPPLLARRLSGFALDLVSNRAGVWAQVDLEAVLYALVPTHVRSPRRVKTLLNNFVTTYRLARRRADAGMLSGDLAERAAELAKLVCLRTEFPLFAADLALDARLPEYVVTVASEQQLPTYVADEVAERATRYAEGRLAVDELLIEERGKRSVDSAPARGQLGENGFTTEQGEGSRGEEPVDDDDATTSVAEVRSRHAAQLLRYLQKTVDIPGPGRDLVHLESGGFIFGLDPAFAEQLEVAAVDGRRDEVARGVGGLNTQEDRRGALQLLAQRTKEARLGPEGANMISALLLSLRGLPQEDIEPIADELADAVAGQRHRYELSEEDLVGAYQLGLESSRTVGSELVEAVLQRTEVLEDEGLGLLVVRKAGATGSADRARVGEVAAAWLIKSPEAATEALLDLEDETAHAVLEAATDPLRVFGGGDEPEGE